jgi:hypothetical protein
MDDGSGVGLARLHVARGDPAGDAGSFERLAQLRGDLGIL